MVQNNKWQHPELLPGEVYVGNVENNGVRFTENKHFRFSFPSERLGKVAYYRHGLKKNQSIPKDCKLRPWFALETEVLASGMCIV